MQIFYKLKLLIISTANYLQLVFYITQDELIITRVINNWRLLEPIINNFHFEKLTWCGQIPHFFFLDFSQGTFFKSFLGKNVCSSWINTVNLWKNPCLEMPCDFAWSRDALWFHKANFLLVFLGNEGEFWKKCLFCLGFL